jgi:ribosomal protein L7/L12
MNNARKIMSFRKATGLGVLDAKNFLMEHPQILCDKILLNESKR